MVQHETSDDLAGKLLIAMPSMADTRFERSVIYLCEHNAHSSMGLIVNKPMADIGFSALLEQLSIPVGPALREIGVHFGGPVDHARGFVLHSAEYHGDEGTMRLRGGFSMTATTDILADLAHGGGPDRALMALGYAGWGPGQLMAEIRQNGWLTCAADPDVVFGRDDDGKWSAALALMGVDPLTLSGAAGHA
ncbi:YqgE/AlgH family protein [Oceaniglobus roseus]|uniref:YqgE/AlgH family protein n=1 Tax=Oceaniglobus roseus TaxID=1737570 RepID=UPI000C7F119B|nr:YqgE/AlgH family protein [Kandeliimicrobium roseum]